MRIIQTAPAEVQPNHTFLITWKTHTAQQCHSLSIKLYIFSSMTVISLFSFITVFFPLVTKTVSGVYEATQNDGCCHQVITTAKNELGTRKSYPHPYLARGEDQHQLTFRQSNAISYKLTLVFFVLICNAKRLGGNRDGLSMLPKVLMVIPFCKHLPAIMGFA